MPLSSYSRSQNFEFLVCSTLRGPRYHVNQIKFPLKRGLCEGFIDQMTT